MKVEELTHVHYAFFEVTSSCNVASIDEYADFQLVQEATPGQTVQGNIAAFRALRQQQAALGGQLKLDLSIGGWTKSTHFSGCAKTAAGRNTITRTALAMLDRTGFDGIDVDWEYPVCCGLSSNEVDPADWANYVLLLKQLREALDTKYPDAHKELTIAMGMSPSVTGVAPMAELGDLLDAINLMTYDYNGAWDASLAAHNAPLFADPAYAAAGGNPAFNIDYGVKEWLKVVPASKLVLGLPSYGRGFVGTTNEYGAGTDGVSGSPPWYENGLLSYWDIVQNYVGNPSYERHWNPISMVPYLTGVGSFISYDDEQSIAVKAKYAKSLGLAGVMWWEASEDKDSLLLVAANQAWASTNAATTIEMQATSPPANAGLAGVGVLIFILLAASFKGVRQLPGLLQRLGLRKSTAITSVEDKNTADAAAVTIELAIGTESIPLPPPPLPTFR